MANPKLTAASEVQFLKGVGPQRAQLLAERGIRTVEDLLYYTPFRYEDRSRMARIRDLVPGQTATIFAKVLTCGLMRTRRGLEIYDLAASDSTGMLRCKWFNGGYLERNKVFHTGQQAFFYGKAVATARAREPWKLSNHNLRSCPMRKPRAAVRWKSIASFPFMNPWRRSDRASCAGSFGEHWKGLTARFPTACHQRHKEKPVGGPNRPSRRRTSLLPAWNWKSSATSARPRNNV